MALSASARAAAPVWRLMAVGLVLIALQSLALQLHGRWDADYGFVAAGLAAGGVYLLAIRVIARSAPGPGAFAVVLVVTAALRGLLLFEPTLHSTDAYRYVWDGRVQAARVNPYRYVPADPALAGLRDEAIYPHINRADYAVTIYPPVAQAAFRLVQGLGDTLLGLKLGFLALEALAMWGLLRLLSTLGRPRVQLLVYSWHPLPIWEVAGDAHVDAGMMALLVLALWAASAGRGFLSGVLLAGSVLFKPLTAAALPAFWHPWDWRVPTGFVVAAGAAYLAYVDAGAGVLGFLAPYTAEEGLRDGSGFFLLGLLGRLAGELPAWASAAYLLAAGTLLAGLAVAFVREPRRDAATRARQAQWLLFAFLLLLSPNYPWYFLVLVPLGCLAPWPPALALTLTAVVLYAAPPVDGDARTFAAQGLLHAVVAVALLAGLYRYWRRSDTPRTAASPRPRQ